jgi:hypothetical protein
MGIEHCPNGFRKICFRSHEPPPCPRLDLSVMTKERIGLPRSGNVTFARVLAVEGAQMLNLHNCPENSADRPFYRMPRQQQRKAERPGVLDTKHNYAPNPYQHASYGTAFDGELCHREKLALTDDWSSRVQARA